MDYVSAELFLLDQVPNSQRALIPTALRSAYRQIDFLVKEEDLFKIPSAEDNRGRLIAWAVDFAIIRLIEAGQLKVDDYRWMHFSKPTGRYLEIRLPHSKLTISQIKYPERQPRDAVFRANARLNNEPFLDLPEFREEEIVHGLPHLLLIHGYQELNFVHLAVPHALHDRNYLYKTDNLLNMPHEIILDTPPVEHTDYDAAMTLKDEIEKWRRDNG